MNCVAQAAAATHSASFCAGRSAAIVPVASTGAPPAAPWWAGGGEAMGSAIGRAALLFLVLVANPAFAGVPPPPECSGASGLIVLPVGTPFTPTLTGTGTGTMTVHDNGTLPPGATLAPPDGTVGVDPFDVLFSFTPTLVNAGNTYNVSIGFEDLFTSQGYCEFSIEVPAVATTSTTVTTVTTSTSITTSSTTTTTLSDCGNNVIDAGEECDPPNGETCNNLSDDDGDMLVDCEDPDCAPLSAETCGTDCLLVEPCQPIEKDPARIRLDDNGPDSFWIHGRFALQSTMDPSAEGFGVSLSNANGVVYRATGLYSAGVRLRKFRGVDYLVFRLRAYADFSAATEARMTTGIVVGNDIGSLTADWVATRDGWRLNQRDY
jgi:hypothetical protein